MNKFDYTKLRFTDDYLQQFEEEEGQTDKKLDKKEPPKKPTKTDVKEFNKLIIEKETGMNKELSKKYFNFQMLTAMLKAVYNTDSKKKNDDLVNVIKNKLSDFKG